MPIYYYLFFAITVIEFFVSFMATVHLGKYKNSTEYYFFHFLWFTFFMELVAGILGNVFEINTKWIYNIYMLISFSFYFHWYRSILKRKEFRNTVLVFIILFVCTSLWNFAFQDWNYYHKYTFVTGALFTMVCTLFHFGQLLGSDEVLDIRRNLSFWISTGLLLFNMGMVPLMLLSRNLNFSELHYFVLIVTLNLILYGCYSIGFLWTREKYNRY